MQVLKWLKNCAFPLVVGDTCRCMLYRYNGYMECDSFSLLVTKLLIKQKYMYVNV